jgi:hypothetical protein
VPLAQHDSNMGPQLERDAMAEVQELVHVEQPVPPPTDEVHCLPTGHDLLRRERELRNGCTVGYVQQTASCYHPHR